MKYFLFDKNKNVYSLSFLVYSTSQFFLSQIKRIPGKILDLKNH